MLELDLLRLGAAVAVLLYHFTWNSFETGASAVGYPSALTAWTRYGFFGIEVFFLISGLVITRSVAGRTAGRFAIARAIRLYPAYWAAVTFTALLLLWLGPPGSVVVTPGRYLVNMTMLTEFVHGTYLDHVYWTLTAELTFYVLVALTLAVASARALPWMLAGWLGAVVVNDRILQSDGLTLWLATRTAPYFVVGATLALLAGDGAPGGRHRSGSGRIGLWVLGGAALVLAVRAAVVRVDAANQVIFGPGSYQKPVAVAIVLLAVALLAAVATGRSAHVGRPWMTTAALVTYPLYLVHSSIGLVLFHRWSGWNRWLLLVAVTSIAVGVATAIHLGVERPLSAAMRRAMVGRRDRPAAGAPPRPVTRRATGR
jgi:peptidoglycan/LPS O-acetylase OafA/YrhL